MTTDIRIVRAFLEAELQQRQEGGERLYVKKAQTALEAFNRIAGTIEDAERAKQTADFDAVFGPDGDWQK